MTVRVRGIYTTALTALFDDIVQASDAIDDRFEAAFPTKPAAVHIETSSDRQGVGVHGRPADVSKAVSSLQEIGIDTLAWRSALPRGGVYAGEVVDTLGSGALLRCRDGEQTPNTEEEGLGGLSVGGEPIGFLPYSKTSRRIEEGDRLRVQVSESRAPWGNGRPVLDTDIRIEGGLASLVRGSTPNAGAPDLADIIPAEPPAGWGVDWHPRADDAGLDELGTLLDGLTERAESLDHSLAGSENATAVAPEPYYEGGTSCWVWFGRESRFALDELRRDVMTTMTGHHRIKAGTGAASAAVDFVEAICDDPTEGEFPFDVVTAQFGPETGETVSIGHGKPDGRLIDLGTGTVTEKEPSGKVTVTREMSSRGSYDALGTDREPGDVATTKFQEGRWWYPTVYRSESGESKGTYVNICTPVEVFPETIRYVDLHVDVIKHPDGTVERVDSDELAAAVDQGTIPETLAAKARQVASAVENAF